MSDLEKYFEKRWGSIREVLTLEIPTRILVAAIFGFIGSWIIPPIPLAVIIFSIILPFLREENVKRDEQREVGAIQNERKRILEKIEEKGNIIGVVQLNLNELNRVLHHQQEPGKAKF